MEKVKDVAVEMFCGVAGELLSALEVVKGMSEENEEVKVVLEAPTPPLLKSCLVVVNHRFLQERYSSLYRWWSTPCSISMYRQSWWV